MHSLHNDSALSTTSIADGPLSADGLVTEKKKSRFSVLPNPFRSLLLLKEKSVAVILLYNSLQFGAMFSVLSSITELFVNTYGINEFQVGLCFLSSGLGAAMGSFISGKILNWRYKKIANSLGFADKHVKGRDLDPKFPIERARTFNALLIVYGWCIYYAVNLSVPVIIIFVLGFTSTATYNATNTLLVDLFPDHSAVIVACNNIPRCLIGGSAVMLVHPGIEKLKVGWFFTTLSLILFISRLSMVIELKMTLNGEKNGEIKTFGSC